MWWLLGDKASESASLRVLRFLALVGTLVGLEGRVLLPTFGHYLGLHYPWNIIAISAALMGAGSLMLLHFEGQGCATGNDTATTVMTFQHKLEGVGCCLLSEWCIHELPSHRAW